MKKKALIRLSPFQKTAQNRWGQHLLFWALSLYVLFRLFNINEHMQLTDFYYTLLFHISLFGLVYLNTRLLIPKLLSKNYYLFFLLGSISIIGLSSLINQFTFTTLTDWLLPGYYFISYYTFWDIVQFMVAYWAISTALKLAKSWFTLTEQRQKIQELQQQKTEVELSALKAQINPHFLFNSLNNIYSLALYENPKTPAALLQLSQCMRYVLYDCKTEQIELNKEIDFLKNYTGLFLLRSDPKLDFQAHYPNHTEQVKIAPLMLLILLENAFKHLRQNKENQLFIHTKLTIEKNELYFEVSNSYHGTKPSTQGPGGLGLDNLKKRLQLLYPQKHVLSIIQKPQSFYTLLQLTL